MIGLFLKKENCCGCTACMSICPKSAINMQPDEEGFLYPIIDENKCVDCGLCKKVCSFQNGYDIAKDFELPYVYAVKHKDEQVRLSSSSGGVFTAISDFILEHDGLVYGAAFDKNMVVCHQKAESKEERDKFKGSKYVQSNLHDTFSEIKKLLLKEGYVLFSGTPCQVSGLKSYLNNINTEKLLLCDIVCHGTPSPLIFKKYIAFSEKKHKSKIVAYYCRDKINGWCVHTEKAVYADKSEDIKTELVSTYKNLFYSHNILRPSCHNCKYTNFNRPSDITIADFWGIENCISDFDDNKGVSLVLINTSRGQELFENIKHNLDYRKSNTKDCIQPQLHYPCKPSPIREKFWEDYYTFGFEYVIKKYVGYDNGSRIKRKFLNSIRIILIKLNLLNIVKKILKRKVNTHV